MRGRDCFAFRIDTIIAGSPRWERDMLYVYGKMLTSVCDEGLVR